MKPTYKLANIFSSPKDKIDPDYRQGAIYEIPCLDCNQVMLAKQSVSSQPGKKTQKQEMLPMAIPRSDQQLCASTLHCKNICWRGKI